MSGPLPHCSKTDAVLALYLDGDIGTGGDASESGFDFVCSESLAEHLRDCGVCRCQLQRARRLDAVLAGNSGRVAAAHRAGHGGTNELDELAAQWFLPERFLPERFLPERFLPERLAPERAVVRVTAAPARPAARLPGSPPGWSARWSSTVAASLAGIGLVIAAWCSGRAAMPATPSTVPLLPPAALAPNAPAAAAVAPAIHVAVDAPRRRAQQLADGQQATEIVPFDRLAEQRRLADPRLSPGERVAAAKQLLQAARPGSEGAEAALGSLTEVLAASQPDAAGHAAMVAIHAAAAHEACFLTHLRAVLQRLDHPRGRPGLDDCAALTVAARLDRRDLDAAVLRAVRRHPELAPVLAAALRSDLRPYGANDHSVGALLLDAWGDLTARGALADDEASATLWFAGQSAATFEQVRAELAASRSAERRVRCLLVFGACPDEQNLDVLVEWTRAGCRDEAHAAAFALARQPSRTLRTLVGKAAQRDAFLLRAALARAAMPEAEAWLAPLALTGAERALLSGCTFAQFPIVAAWFRDGAGPSASPLASGE